MMPGLLLILSAPSGAGKTTIAHRLLEELGDQGLFSISYTTRSPRGQERDGGDYHFVTPASFQAMVEKGELLEWAEVHGQWYGSHIRYAEEAQRGRVVIFDIDVQGGAAIKARYPEAVSIFIVPPSHEELERRLRGRATDSDQVIARRLLAARSEIVRGSSAYDYVVVNRFLDKAADDVRSIVRAELLRRGRAALPVL